MTTTVTRLNAPTFGAVARGVAFGDAWGDPVEFKSIESILKDGEKGPELPLQLDVTDDTQMTLFLADALDLSADDDIPAVKRAIMDAFRDYKSDKDTPSRAPGVTVMGSLGSLGGGYDWKRATNANSDGSGTIMRTSATAFLPEDRWLGATAFAALVTHGAANSLAAAIIQAKLIRDLNEGKICTDQLTYRVLELAAAPEQHGLLPIDPAWIEDYDVDPQKGFDEIARLALGALEVLPKLLDHPWDLGPDSDPSNQKFFGATNGAGWRAHHTLLVATLAVDMFPGQPWEALRRAVATDGDSDTNAAVAGALLGAAHPETFMDLWEVYADRFETRYIRWIENEADDYDFTPDGGEVIDVEVDPEFVANDGAEARAVQQAALALDFDEVPEKEAVAEEFVAAGETDEDREARKGFMKRVLGRIVG